MLKITRRPAALAAAAVSALVLAACGGSPSDPPNAAAAGAGVLPKLAADQNVKIAFSSYNLSSNKLGAPSIKQLVKDFEAAHPNVTVELRSAEQTDYAAAVRRQAATGDAPDLAQMIFSDLAFSVSSLRAQPLEELVGSSELQSALGGEHPFDARAAKLGITGGKTYALPWMFSTPVLYYNADLLRKAGLDADAPPRTWDAVGSAAQAIKSKTGKSGLGLMCLDLTIQTDWCLQGVLLSNGADVMTADEQKIVWSSPQAADALTRMQKLVTSGAATSIGGYDQMDAFASGKLGMMISTSAVQGTLLDGINGRFPIKAAPMPSFGDRPAAPTNSGAGLVILASDPAKQAAAWELMKWLTADQAQTTISKKIGYLPSRTGLVDDERYLKGWAVEQKGLLEPNIAQLAELARWRSFPGARYKEIQQLLMDAATAIIFRKADAATTLAEAQTRAQELMPGA